MLHWRLYYNDIARPTLDQQPGLASIVHAPKAARAITVVGDDGNDIIGCNLGSNERPVFYTVRSVTADMAHVADPDGTSRVVARFGEPRTDIVVFGRGWEAGDRIESVLWAVWRDGRVTDCPARFLDEKAVERAVMGT